MPTRRDALRLLAALPPLAAWPAAAATPPTLVARPFEAALAPDLPPTRLWGFDVGGGATMPGPVLRHAQGDRFARTIHNDLPAPTAVHWHGLRVPNAMDGVPGLTGQAIPPGGTAEVAFDLRDAGSYWYHSHMRSFEQVERGLHGAFVVDEAEGAPDVDADHVLVLDDLRLERDLQLAAFGGAHDHSHGGRIGNLPLANGRPEARLTAAPGARLRLRLVGAQTARVFVLRLAGLTGWTLALDGQPLERPEPVTDDLVLGPAQRIDLIVDVTAEAGAEAHLLSMERDGGYALVSLAAEGRAQARHSAPGPLPPNPGWPEPDLAAARAVAMPIEGGAMGRMDGAVLGGARLGFRDLAARGAYWSLAGRADRGETPLVTAAPGETVRLDLDNRTRWPHAMHLHGYHFREVMPEGGLGPLRDTLLLAAGEAKPVAFVAERPGDWLVHCHMLGHAASGMSTWLRVV